MLDRYLSVLQAHHPDFVARLPVLIDTVNTHYSDDTEDWATKVGQMVMAITGRLD